MRRLHLCKCLDMTLDQLNLHFCSFGECGVPSIAIIPRSTLTRSFITYKDPLYGFNPLTEANETISVR